MTDPGRKDRLTDAVQAVLEAKREEAIAARESALRLARRKRRQPVLVVLILLGWGLLAWLWLTRPAFIFEPEAAAVQAPKDPEASARYALYLERARLVEYHDRTGVWPTTLEQAGPPVRGVHLLQGGPAYRLAATAGTKELVMDSTMPADSFLGDALSRLGAEGDQ